MNKFLINKKKDWKYIDASLHTYNYIEMFIKRFDLHKNINKQGKSENMI